MFQLKSILNSKTLKNGMFYTIFAFANNGISFILLLILTKYLQPSEYGSLNLFSTFVTILTLIISLSTTSYIAVAFFRKDIHTFRKIISISLGITTFMLIIIMLLLFTFPTEIQKIVGVKIKFLWIGVMISYFSIYNNVNLDIWRIEEKPIIYGVYSFSFAILNFAITLWLIVGENLGWAGRVYSWGGLSILYFLLNIFFLVHNRYLTLYIPSKSLIKETLIFSLPLIPHNVSFWLKQGADKYILNYFYDTSIVGYFSFAMNMAAIITIIGTAFNASNSVYSFKTLTNLGNTGARKLMHQAKYISLAFLIIAIIVIFIAYIFIKQFILKYDYSTVFLIPLGIGAFFQCLYYLWINYLVYFKKTLLLMIITLSTTIVQITISLIITRYSPLYTAWNSCIFTAITVISLFISAKYIIAHNKHKLDENRKL